MACHTTSHLAPHPPNLPKSPFQLNKKVERDAAVRKTMI